MYPTTLPYYYFLVSKRYNENIKTKQQLILLMSVCSPKSDTVYIFVPTNKKTNNISRSYTMT